MNRQLRVIPCKSSFTTLFLVMMIKYSLLQSLSLKRIVAFQSRTTTRLVQSSRNQKRHFNKDMILHQPSSFKVNISPNIKIPARVVLDPLPIAYVYDHCPFCVRVRFALGLKNVKHTNIFLANDDVATPTYLVGKKIAPIFQYNDIVMPESWDIIQYIDSDPTFGPIDSIAPSSGRTDLVEWQNSARDLLRYLQRPRYVSTGLLPEFQQSDGRNAFISNHPVPPYDNKAEWKQLGFDKQFAIYLETMLEHDQKEEIQMLNQKLITLNDMIYCDYYCTEGSGSVSYDDIDLFSRLRSITIIKNVRWPTKLRNYMNHLSSLTDIPLYDEMAL
jgi:glutaredoxin 2